MIKTTTKKTPKNKKKTILLYKLLQAQDFADAYKSQDAIFFNCTRKTDRDILLSRNCAIKSGFELNCLKIRFNYPKTFKIKVPENTF